ncbi:replicative DNA helicase [Nosocomiicoccus sp. HMSC09A07]|uniref:replicative DNA helicase n=1 Tax=Nosocomiicoccus sp. HMSC09A07 TaxID=1581145 RepID=UPI0008A35737|nr:replicative DNA helicase [Nosocomiicoccus sp. HMSC09A07]OFS63037.1 replicative DNA helicase [Nosocomiicoccus sp. HMSC09A07]
MENNNHFPRQMPHSTDAEQALLGAVLIDPEIMIDVETTLEIDDFYERAHQLIYSSMLEVNQANKKISPLLLMEHFKVKNIVNDVGGLSYLTNLFEMSPTSSNWEEYADIIRKNSLRRVLIRKAERLSLDSFNPETNVEELIAEAEKSMMDIEKDRRRDGFKTMRDVVYDIFTEIDEYSKLDNKGITGIPTGYRQLDKMTSGLQPNDLIILAARPSMGKTAFALNIAENVGMSSTNKNTVAIFSLEMGAEQLATRMISSVGHIDSSSLRNRQLNQEEWDNLAHVTGKLSDTNIFIDDTPGIRVNEIRSKCIKLKAQHGLDLIIIDYLQLIQGSSRRNSENRQQEVSEISRMLKALAREMECPVIALSQLSRSVESRQDKRPMMSDLRESGSIEQDADIVAFLYRDDYYNRGEGEDDEGAQSTQDEIEIIIAKHRNGPTGTVKLMFNKQHSNFIDLAIQEFEDGYIPPGS